MHRHGGNHHPRCGKREARARSSAGPEECGAFHPYRRMWPPSKVSAGSRLSGKPRSRCALPTRRGRFRASQVTGAPRGQRPSDGAGKASDKRDARDGRASFHPIDPSQRRERGVIEADAHSEAQDEPGKPQHCLRMRKARAASPTAMMTLEAASTSRPPMASTVRPTRGPTMRRNDQRSREGCEEPRARDAQIVGDAVGKDGRQIVARCPRKGLGGAKHQDDRQAIVRGHASLA